MEELFKDTRTTLFLVIFAGSLLGGLLAQAGSFYTQRKEHRYKRKVFLLKKYEILANHLQRADSYLSRISTINDHRELSRFSDLSAQGRESNNGILQLDPKENDKFYDVRKAAILTMLYFPELDSICNEYVHSYIDMFGEINQSFAQGFDDNVKRLEWIFSSKKAEHYRKIKMKLFADLSKEAKKYV